MRITLASNPKLIGGQSRFVLNLESWAEDCFYTVSRNQYFFVKSDFVVIISSSRKVLWVIWQKLLGAEVILRLDNIDSGYKALGSPFRVMVVYFLIYFYGQIASRIIYQSSYAQGLFARFNFNTKKETVVFNPSSLTNLSNNLERGNRTPFKDVKLLLVEGSYDETDEFVNFIQFLNNLTSISTIIICGFVTSNFHKRISFKKVKLRGLVEPNSMCELYEESDIFVSVEKNPACSNSVIEALSFGVPVIGWDTGSIKELVSNDVGVVLGPQILTTDGFREAVYQISSNYVMLSENCRKRALKKHSPKLQFQKYFF